MSIVLSMEHWLVDSRDVEWLCKNPYCVNWRFHMP